MPYFFSEKNLSQDQLVEVNGEEARHILLAHRAKKGEKVKLQGPDGKRFMAQILSAGKGVVKFSCIEELKVPDEFKTELVLFQSVVSEKALDFILQKGTELGLNKIVVFNSQNTAVKLSREKFETKKDRWEKIVKESAKQSERGVWPELEFVSSFKETLALLSVYDRVYLADVSGQTVRDVGLTEPGVALKNYAVVIGPEGGLTKEEVLEIKKIPDCRVLNLGPVLLKADTAGLAALVLLRNLLN